MRVRVPHLSHFSQGSCPLETLEAPAQSARARPLLAQQVRHAPSVSCPSRKAVAVARGRLCASASAVTVTGVLAGVAEGCSGAALTALSALSALSLGSCMSADHCHCSLTANTPHSSRTLQKLAPEGMPCWVHLHGRRDCAGGWSALNSEHNAGCAQQGPACAHAIYL